MQNKNIELATPLLYKYELATPLSQQKWIKSSYEKKNENLTKEVMCSF